MKRNEVEEVIYDTFDRLDFKPKRKVGVRLSNKAFYVENRHPVFGVVQVHEERDQPNIHFPLHFQKVVYRSVQEDIIRHEACHFVQSQLNDFESLVTDAHGVAFIDLMNKIDCNLYTVDIDSVDTKEVPFYLPSNKPCKVVRSRLGQMQVLSHEALKHSSTTISHL